MSPPSLRLLQNVRAVLVVTVILICTLLLTVKWQKTNLANPLPALCPFQGSSTIPHRTQTLSAQQQPTRGQSSDVSAIRVLGKPLDRCATSQAVKLAEEEDIYVSIKTASKNHDSRMLPVLLTWLQTLQPQQIHVITDVMSKDEPLNQIGSKTGIDVLATGCSTAHTKEALCCKSSNEYWRYLNTTKESGELYRWYCHFDDDAYVNIPVLVTALREAMSKSHDGGVYFGRWPEEMVPSMPKGLWIAQSKLKSLGFDFKRGISVKWATGAAYCVSSTVMKKIRDILRKHTFEQYCAAFGVSDDVTAAILVGIAGYAVSDNKRVKTHYDPLKTFSVSELRNMVTIGQKNTQVVEVPDSIFSLEEDPTRFLSYHCLLYPSTSWCSKST